MRFRHALLPVFLLLLGSRSAPEERAFARAVARDDARVLRIQEIEAEAGTLEGTARTRLLERAASMRREADRDAIRRWKEFLEDHPENAEAHNYLGLLYYDSGQPHRARRLEPTNYEYARAIAQNYQFTTRFGLEEADREAAEAWKTCLAMELTDLQRVYCLTNLARIEIRRERPEAARYLLDEALRLAPDSSAARNLRGEIEGAADAAVAGREC